TRLVTPPHRPDRDARLPRWDVRACPRTAGEQRRNDRGEHTQQQGRGREREEAWKKVARCSKKSPRKESNDAGRTRPRTTTGAPRSRGIRGARDMPRECGAPPEHATRPLLTTRGGNLVGRRALWGEGLHTLGFSAASASFLLIRGNPCRDATN